jgi:hypothetical protein
MGTDSLTVRCNALFLDYSFDYLIVRDVNCTQLIASLIGISTFLGLMHCNERSANPSKLDVTSPLSEDITFLTEVATESTIQVVRFNIKDGKGLTRMDDARFTTIHDPEQGLYFLDHKLKKFRHVSGPKIPERKPDSEATEHERKQYDLVEKSAKMAYSGREKLIGKSKCKEFVIWDSYKTGVPSHLESSIVAWISEEFENGKELQKRQFDLAPLPLLSQFSQISGKTFELPGFAIQMIVREADGLPSIITHREIIRQPLNNADFEIPADYTSADD